MWIALGRRFSKKSLWLAAMASATAAFIALFFVQEGAVFLILFVVFALGVGLGGGDVIAPSIQADVIDYDDYMTGERKEGAYIAIWNFIRKAGGGVTAGITGFALQSSGYLPNADEQTEAVKATILALMGLLPALCYAIGIVLFWRFAFNRAEHAEVIEAIQERDRQS
jgi:GPH family glycoside/pentoside/hexuronide:cation symporter